MFLLKDKVVTLEKSIKCLSLPTSHYSICRLKNFIAMPKLLYTLRTSPCAGNPLLQEFDHVLRTGLETIVNVQLSDLQWMEGSLPVHMGGLGVRSVCLLASSAFLASAAAMLPLQDEILLASSLAGVENKDVSNARATWNGLAMANEPIEASKHTQRAWDAPIITAAYNKFCQVCTARRPGTVKSFDHPACW